MNASACIFAPGQVFTTSLLTTCLPHSPRPSLCAGINPDTACRPPGLRFASSRSAPPPTVPLEVQFSPGIPMGAAMEANLLQQLKADKCIMAAEEALNGSVSDYRVYGRGDQEVRREEGRVRRSSRQTSALWQQRRR